MTKKELAEQALRWMEAPYSVLRADLCANGDSSLTLAEKTGVPGATIRSLRNGQSGAVTAATWGRLMSHMHAERLERVAGL